MEHVLNVLHFVVAQHHKAGSLARSAKGVYIAERLLTGVYRHRTIDGRQVEIAPVNADEVALLSQDGLFDGTDASVVDTLLTAHLRAGGLAGVSLCQ